MMVFRTRIMKRHNQFVHSQDVTAATHEEAAKLRYSQLTDVEKNITRMILVEWGDLANVYMKEEIDD